MIKWLAGRLRAYLLGISLVLVLASGGITPTGAGLPRQEIPIVEPELLTQAARSEPLDFMIVFEEQADLSAAYSMGWDERGWYVYETLTEFADQSQARVRHFLDRTGVNYQAFWAANLIIVEGASSAALNGLMNFTEIERLETLPQVMLMIPEDEWEETDPAEEFSPEDEMTETSEPADNEEQVNEQEQIDLLDEGDIQITNVESNISQIKADQVWDIGYTGTGLVVGSIDTGVRYTHNALVSQYRGNLGGGSFNHNYNWWDPVNGKTTPEDFHGHGSHTTGTMIGDDGGSNQIGVAPGAKWIACNAFHPTQGGVGVIACGEFMVAPTNLAGNNPNPSLRPHVVNNSWGNCQQVYHDFYQGVVTAWLAAGIYPVFANGNAGNCGYSSPPGLNTVGNPARYGNVTGVGSTGKDNGQYANHSNWGPTDNLDTINPSGYPDLKPQVVAPGVNIRSATSTHNNSYGFGTGTSMSAPQAAGLVALMWQAAPCLLGNYAATETIIEQTATAIVYNDGSPDTPGHPNYATGWGEINALQAVTAAGLECGDPPPCYSLTRHFTGSGSAPVPSPIKSSACSADYTYQAGEIINLTANPDQGWQVASWEGTDNDSSTSTTNSVTMPSSNWTVTVNYEVLLKFKNEIFLPLILH